MKKLRQLALMAAVTLFSGGAFAVTLVQTTPSAGTTNTTLSSVYLTGSGFVSGATVKLTKTGQADINATAVNVLSDASINCSFPLAGAATGQWNIVVTNADTSAATLSGEFSVAIAPRGTVWKPGISINQARFKFPLIRLDNGDLLAIGGNISSSGGTALAELFSISGGTWTYTGNMVNSRKDHSAVKLLDGRVLAAGGYLGATGVKTSEIYDPATSAWTATGDMMRIRQNFSLVRLTNGKVLAVSGKNSMVIAFCDLYDPTAGTWTGTGAVNHARQSHTATLLADGTVLAVGGYSDTASGTSIQTSEIFNGATWSDTAGTMTVARGDHTATLLTDGKVLVVGGKNSGTYLSSAELYDPATGLWTATGDLNTARAYHTALLMPDGKVLVTGGYSGTADLSTAEIYDPAAGTWSSVGSLSSTRQKLASAYLPNGEIMTVGGFRTGGYTLSDTSLYGYALYNLSGNVTAGGSPLAGVSVAVSGSSTTSVNTNADGSYTVSVYSDGDYTLTPSKTGYSFNPVAVSTAGLAGNWANDFNGTIATFTVSGTVLKDDVGWPGVNVSVTGSSTTAAVTDASGNYSFIMPYGSAITVTPSTTGYHFSPLSVTTSSLMSDWTGNNFAAQEDLRVVAMLPLSAENSGSITSVYVTGAGFVPGITLKLAKTGQSDINATAVTVLSSSTLTCTLPLTGATTGYWTVSAATGAYTAIMPGTFLVTAPGSSVSGKFFMIGYLPSSQLFSSMLRLPDGTPMIFSGSSVNTALYSETTGVWSAGATMNVARRVAGSAVLATGRVIAAGGNDGSTAMSSAEIYDPDTNVWTSTSSMATARQNFTLIPLPNGKVLAAGGSIGSLVYHNTAELFDPQAGTWSNTGSLNAPRSAYTATLLPNGKVLVAGGLTTGAAYLNSAELYDPATGVWTPTGSMSSPRAQARAVALRDGRIIITGGRNGDIYLAGAEIYNPESGTWTSTPDMPVSRAFHAITSLPQGNVFVTGGSNGSYVKSAAIYNVSSNEWFAVSSTSYGAYYNGDSVVPLSNGQLLLAGGPYNSSESFSPYALSVGGTVSLGGSPLSGVSVAITGSASSTLVTGANGTYSFNTVYGGSYTVTPSKTGYAFTPVSISTIPQANDFTGAYPQRLCADSQFSLISNLNANSCLIS